MKPDLRELSRILKDLLRAYAALRRYGDDETERNFAYANIRRRAYELLTWLADAELKPNTKEK